MSREPNPAYGALSNAMAFDMVDEPKQTVDSYV